MKQPQLLELIRQAFKEKMGSYVDTPALEEYLLTPMLADDAGLIGCLALAIKKLEQQQHVKERVREFLQQLGQIKRLTKMRASKKDG